MEPLRQAPDSGFEGATVDGASLAAAAAPGRVAGGLHTRDPLPIVEGPADCHTMVPAGIFTTGRGLDDPDRAPAAVDVEFAGVGAEGSQSRTMQTSGTPAAMPSPAATGSQECGEGQNSRENQIQTDLKALRNSLRQIFRILVMDNSSNWCYANSAFLTFLWVTLSRTSFEPNDWGEFSELFQGLLQQFDGIPIQLENLEWFQNLIAAWSERHGQADSSEFSGILLKGIDPPCCSHRWDRRVLQAEKVLIHDRGDKHMPITIQIEPELQDTGSIRLVDLIRHWHQELGMRAGLTTESELVCVHLDRFVRLPSGQIQKSMIPIGFHWGVPFPVFTSDTECDWQGYQVMAAFAHLGSTESGHYNCILRVDDQNSPDREPALWIHCDDNRAPVPYWYLPEEFAANVTCFWLCKCEVLDHHDMRQDPPALPVPTSTQRPVADHAVLEMLNQLPG